jgi:hypothetical protein
MTGERYPRLIHQRWQSLGPCSGAERELFKGDCQLGASLRSTRGFTGSVSVVSEAVISHVLGAGRAAFPHVRGALRVWLGTHAR